MRADMTVYQPGTFLYNLLIKKIQICNKFSSGTLFCNMASSGRYFVDEILVSLTQHSIHTHEVSVKNVVTSSSFLFSKILFANYHE